MVGLIFLYVLILRYYLDTNRFSDDFTQIKINKWHTQNLEDSQRIAKTSQ